MSSKTIIAYGFGKEHNTKLDYPLIPDHIILRQDNIKYIDRFGEFDISEEWYKHLISIGSSFEIECEVEWKDSSWVVIKEHNEVMFFWFEEETSIRSKLAHELLNEASSLIGRPEKALSLLRASGNLAMVPIDTVQSIAEAYAKLFELNKMK